MEPSASPPLSRIADAALRGSLISATLALAAGLGRAVLGLLVGAAVVAPPLHWMLPARFVVRVGKSDPGTNARRGRAFIRRFQTGTPHKS